MTNARTLTGKRILIFVGDIYEDLELWYPKLRMEEAGADVTLAGPEKAMTYLGKNGYPCVSDAAIDNMQESDFDGLIVPGGFMPDKLRRDPKVLQFQFNKTGHLFERFFGISGRLWYRIIQQR